MRGAELVVNTLRKAKVKHIFALSGNQIMPIFDACIDAGIAIYHVRHEAAATYMADAYAQLTGEIGVALVTAGPGFANSLSPLYSARLAESPVLLLSGDSPRAADGKNAFQELDQVSASSAITKYSCRSKGVDTISTEIASCIQIAKSERPGPVHLALPFDNLTSLATNPNEASLEAFKPKLKKPSLEIINTIVHAIKKAVHPIILTGPMLNHSRTGNLHDMLSNALDAPTINMESPRGVKDPSLGRFASTLVKSDLVLLIGKRLDFTLGNGQPPIFSPGCKFIIADPDKKELEQAEKMLGNNINATFVANATTLANALCQTKALTNRNGWRKEVSTAIAYRSTSRKTTKGIHPAIVGEAIQTVINGANDPILIVDGGEFGQWAQATIHSPTRVINGLSGAIGGGLCYAFAAKIARPESTVIALMGDGTVGFHFAEFETASRYGADFIAVIGNDARWNAEYQIQLRDYGSQRAYGCELRPTAYDQAAIGLGCHGALIKNPTELQPALGNALTSGMPGCLNVMIEGLPAP
tara:strand:+ start:4082 stop:5668 length:1587 start_codon:yes stop_codon:yes gene_type:complete